MGEITMPVVIAKTKPAAIAYIEAKTLPDSVFIESTGPMPLRIIAAFNTESSQVKWTK